VKYRTKHIVEYAFLKLVAGTAKILPRRAALALGWLIAFTAFYVFRFRRKIVRKRIRQVLGESMSNDQTDRIAWLSLRNVMLSAIDVIRAPITKAEELEKMFSCRTSLEPVRKLAESGKGAIIALPHMGSWEASASATFNSGIPLFSFAATQKNPLVDAYMNRLREGPGIEALPRTQTSLKKILKKLKNGKVLAILPDVRMREKALTVPFLNGHANIGAGMAMFARHTNAPIYPCIVRRKGWIQHSIELLAPINPDPSLSKDEDIQRMTNDVFKIFNDAILKNPEQWFWYNKRWILDPIET